MPAWLFKAGASFTNWMGDPTGWQPVSGTLMFKGIANGVHLPHGLYIIAADNKAYKVTIR